MGGIRAWLDSGLELIWSLMKVKGDDWLDSYPARSAMPRFAGLTSVSKGHAPELWHFSCICLDSSQALLSIKGHKNIWCLKDKQVVKEEAESTNKESGCFM